MSNSGDSLKIANRKKRIIDAAVDLILQDDFVNLKLDKVVNRAGTSKSAIYSLFENKEGLLKAICDISVFDVGSDMISQIADDISAKTVLTNLLASYVSHSSSKEYVAAIKVVNSESRYSSTIGKYYLEIGPNRVLKKIEEFLQHKVKVGEMNIPNCALAAKHLIGSLVWYRSSVLIYTNEVDDNVEEFVEHAKMALNAFFKAYSIV